MDFATDGPDEIAAAIAEEIGREVAYRPVEAGGAARAAASIGELLYPPPEPGPLARWGLAHRSGGNSASMPNRRTRVTH
jgi:hypothetical protein